MFGIEKVKTALAEPVRQTAGLAVLALVVAVIALIMSVGGNNAH